MDQLLARMGAQLAALEDIARDYQRMAAETRAFLDQCSGQTDQLPEASETG